MKKYMLFFQIFVLGLCVNKPVMADEQFFKINNPLSKMDIGNATDEYAEILNQLANDIKNDGLVFSYDGSGVAICPTGSCFEVKNVQYFMKKAIFEKYRMSASLLSKKTFFYEAQKKIGTAYIFGDYRGQPKLFIIMEILDSNGKVIASQRLSSELDGYGDGLRYDSFFGYIKELNDENKSFNDVILSSRFRQLRDYGFYLSLKQIQDISSLRFRVIDNPDLNKN